MVQAKMKDGIHTFGFPLVGYSHDGEITTCSVELHLGHLVGHNIGTNSIMTCIIKQEEYPPALEHFIESVCSDLLQFISKYSGKEITPESVCWYQELSYYNNGIWKRVTMKWSKDENCYHSPIWTELEPLKYSALEG